MSYFSSFNYVQYPNFEDTETFLILKNITSRVIRKEDIVDDKSLYYEYVIRNEDNIEDVSTQLYGTPFYYWTMMIINNRFDRFHDFPLSNKQFEDFLIEKYGSVEYALNINNSKYFIRTDELQYSENTKIDNSYFYEVPKNVYDYVSETVERPVYSNGILMKKTKTLYDYELEINDSKRTILVIDRRYVKQFVREFNRLVS